MPRTRIKVSLPENEMYRLECSHSDPMPISDTPILHSTAMITTSLHRLIIKGVRPTSHGGIASNHCLICYCCNYEMWNECQALAKCPQGFFKCSDCKLSPGQRLQRWTQNREEATATTTSIFRTEAKIRTILDLLRILQSRRSKQA